MSKMDLPTEPVTTTGSTNRLVYQSRLESPDRLHIEPAPGMLKASLGALLASPLPIALCCYFKVPIISQLNSCDPSGPGNFAVGLSLFLFAGGLTGVLFHICLSASGLRACFDRAKGQAKISGPNIWPNLTLDLERITAIQLLYAGYAGGVDSGCYHWQLNLVLDHAQGKRVCLVDCGGIKDLKRLAQAIADFTGKPLIDQSETCLRNNIYTTSLLHRCRLEKPDRLHIEPGWTIPWGMRACIDRAQGKVTISGKGFSPALTLEWERIANLQLMGSAHSYQLNLVLKNQEKSICLINCGDLERLRQLSEEVADFSGWPLTEQEFERYR